MIDPISLLIAVLLTWRISMLLVEEDGPLNIFGVIRDASERIPVLGDLLSCIMCASVWVGIGVALMFIGGVRDILILGLALSAGAIIIDRIVEFLMEYHCES